MFQINGKPLAFDTPFTTEDGTQYPANWLRLSSPEERVAIGITEVADPEWYDDRFYWGPGNPKNLETVREMLHSQMKASAFGFLSQTDYKLIRKIETGQDVDAETAAKRTAIREAYTANATAIDSATTVEELAALQFTWPQ